MSTTATRQAGQQSPAQGQGGYRYLFPYIDVIEGEDFIPFSIDLPNDIAAVVGVLVLCNAEVSVAGGDGVAATAISTLEDNIAAAQERYRRTNILNGYFEYQIGYEARERVQLDRYALGTVSLRSFEESGLFYSQTVLPQAFGLHFKSDFGAEAHGRFEYHAVSGKRSAFVPVFVDGISTELFGFFEPTAFGRQVGAADSGLYDPFTEDFVHPYRISLALKCIVKPAGK